MLRALRQRNGEYEPDKLNEIKATGGSAVFMTITETKCRAAESWLRDIMLDEGMVPFGVAPTTIPDLPADASEQIMQKVTTEIIGSIQSTGMAPDEDTIAMFQEKAEQDLRNGIMEYATRKADRMGDRIRDQYSEGGMLLAFDAVHVGPHHVSDGAAQGAGGASPALVGLGQLDGQVHAQDGREVSAHLRAGRPVPVLRGAGGHVHQRRVHHRAASVVRGGLVGLAGRAGIRRQRHPQRAGEHGLGQGLALGQRVHQERAGRQAQHVAHPYPLGRRDRVLGAGFRADAARVGDERGSRCPTRPRCTTAARG